MDGNEEVAELRIANVRGFVVALQAIKAAKPQDCVVTLGRDGLSFRMEDPSKGLQSKVQLSSEPTASYGAQLFTRYRVPGGRKVFALPFKSLLDVLQVMMASTVSAELVLRFPGPNHDLLLTMSEDGMCTYAGIDTVETEIPRDLQDHWQEPESYFIAPGALLKEAVDDLEWAAAGGHQSARSAVHLVIRRDPRALTMFAKGAGELKVRFPMDQVDPFRCAEPELHAAYKHRHLRAAFCNVQHQKDQPAVTTKVTIDSRGMMKVAHMMAIGTGGPGEFPGSQRGSMASQGMTGGRRSTADIQFVIVCEEEDPEAYHVELE